MASSQTFSIKLTANGKEVTDLMDALKEKSKDYEGQLDKINQKLQERDKLTEEEIKALEKESDSLTRKIKALGTAVEENITNLRTVDAVMKNLAGSSGAELGKALRGISQQFKRVGDNTLKAGETMEGKLIEIKEKLIEVRHEMAKRDGIDAMKRAQATLQDLANTPLDKLKMGLDSIEKKLATMSDAERQAADGMTLLSARQRYKAQIAVNEYGRAGTADLSKMNADQLRAEQSRLRSGYMATEEAQGFGGISQEYLTRLQQVNQLLIEKGYAQQKADQAVRDGLAAKEQEAKIDDIIVRNLLDEKISLNELLDTEKALETQLKKMEGLNLTPDEQNELEQTKWRLEGIKKAIDEISLQDLDFKHLDTVPTEKLEAALKNLEQQEKRLTGTQKQEAAEVARKKTLIQTQIQKNKQATIDFANAEKVAGETGKHSVTELQQAYDTLKMKLTGLATNEKKEIARTKEQMAKLKKEIDNVTSAVKTQSTIWQTAVRNITAYIGVFGAFNFIKNKVQQVFESNKQLSDSLANIRKVSGLTSGEINELYTNIAKIDTRNSVEQLNNLAYAGAKLGIQEHGGVSALTGFVRAAEQVQMALGEDLGEEALPALAKLTEVMGLMDMYGVEDAMQKASSAIFMLSTTSTSTGNEIIEFSKRLMGLANVSHISASELLALGSASSSMGLMAEVSSTAFNKVFTKIQSNTAAIEKAVGVAKGSLKSLVDEGKTMEAIVTVFDKMRDMSMEEMQRRGIFTALGSDGARLNNVMTTMADRVDMLKKHLDVANQSFEEGEAVIAEYMIQNQTAAAYMERAANAFEKAFTNPEGVDAVTNLAKQWHDFAIEMTNSTLMMGSLKAALVAILGVVKGLIIVLPLLIQFLLFKGSLAAITQIVTGFVNMSKAIWAAVTASKALTAAQKWNGITTALSLVAAGVMTVISALNEADEATERARQQQQELDKAFASSKDVIDKSTQSLEEYKGALDKSNLSQDERDKRLRAYMKNEYQPYLDFLGIEIDKVEDLANAYAQVTFAIKQKAAAEEKENYRSRVNGDNRNERIAAQAEAIREAQKAGFKIDKKFLDANWEEGINTLYSKITGGGSDAYVTKRGLTFPKYGELMSALKNYQQKKGIETKIDAQTERMFNEEYKDLNLENFSLEDFRQKQMEAQIQREKNRKNTVDMPPTKDELKAAKKAQQEEKQALRKELQDAKQESDAIIAKVEEWYRLQEAVVTGFAADGKWTQDQADMVLKQLEMAKNEALANARLAISGRDTQTWERTKEQMRLLMFDTGEWSQELFQQMMDVSMKNIRQNLANIDKGGGQYGITTSSLKDALDKNAAGNRRKVEEIRNKTAKEVEKMLLQYNYLDKALKAFNERLSALGLLTETAEQAAARIQKASNSLKTPERTEEQMTQSRNEARQQAGLQFVKGGGENFAVDIDSTASLNQWLSGFTGAKAGMGAGGFEFQFVGWADAFKEQFNMWLRDSETYKADIQSFYLSLIDFDKSYYKSIKESYSQQKQTADERWEATGKGRSYEQQLQGLDMMSRKQRLTGADQGTNFAQMSGFAALGTDPEIAASQIRMQQMQEELDLFIKTNDTKKMSAEQLEAFNQLLAEKQQARNEAEMAMEETVMSKINERISKLQEWTQPIEQFGADMGDAFGKAISESESFADGMRNALKSLAQSWGEHTIEIVKQLMMQQLKQKMIGKAMLKEQKATETGMTSVTEQGEGEREDLVTSVGQSMVQATAQMGQQKLATKQQQDAQETTQTAHKTIFDVLAGIAGGSAKTIESLGWWGIPLVAVISALLMGLLNTALSAIGGGSKSSESNAAKTNVKLKSGMLTYDEGNVGMFAGRRKLYDDGTTQVYDREGSRPAPFVGQDGHVYMATPRGGIPEGVSLVKQPIATTVNGQPSLVAEKGPEIVIGRRTTARIMMNEPRLLHHLVTLGNGRRGLRTFDEGNLGDITLSRNNGITNAGERNNEEINAALERNAAALEQNAAAMAAFAEMMQQIQSNGIQGVFREYGAGSLDESMRKVNAFRKRYPV